MNTYILDKMFTYRYLGLFNIYSVWQFLGIFKIILSFPLQTLILIFFSMQTDYIKKSHFILFFQEKLFKYALKVLHAALPTWNIDWVNGSALNLKKLWITSRLKYPNHFKQKLLKYLVRVTIYIPRSYYILWT